MWDFLKKLRKPKEVPAAKPDSAQKPAPAPAQSVQAAPRPVPQAPVPAETRAGAVSKTKACEGAAPAAMPVKAVSGPQTAAVEKPHAQKTDEELAEELNKISPEILSQAKTPEMRKLVINIYRKMLVEGVDVNNEKEVKKWLKRHPEVAAGGDVQKVETVKRAEPKVGRNDPCHCGSGKKYKKCCGAGS